MTAEISQTTQYKIKEMTIITNYGSFDVRNIFDELNLFDHILLPCMSGNIAITDSVGLSDKFRFDGSEYFKIDISKDDDFLRIKKLFHIYKQTNKNSKNMTSETYILHFVSDEFVYSEQQTLNNFINGSYSDVVEMVLTEKLKLKGGEFVYDTSKGVRNIVIPNLNPIETLMWCSKRAVNDQNLPNFLFYENLYKYNFLSLSTLKQQDVVMEVTFEPKNIENNLGKEFFGVRDFEIISQFDYLDNIASGVYSGTFIGFDPLTRTIVEQEISFDKMFTDKPLNKKVTQTNDKNREGKQNNEMKNSRRVVYPTPINRTDSEYIKSNDPTSLNLLETPQYFQYQRRALLSHLFSKRMKVVLPGNFLLTSGVNLLMKKQKASSYQSDDTKDTSLYGKYLIVGTRHVIQNNKHETIVEIVTDSANYDKPPANVDVNRIRK